MQKIVVVVCTLKRPQMLMKCLHSVARQYMPEDWQFEISVIDNDSEPTTKTAVEAWQKTVSVPVHYVHEPVKGIPFARNAGLESALQHNADWVAMIDDDETAPPYWLATLIDGLDLYQCEIVTGFVSSAIDNPPAWWSSLHGNIYPDGKQLTTAGTGNVMFSARLVRPEGDNLRFCTEMVRGGEDHLFFTTATQKGYVIRWITGAILSEEVASSRMNKQRYLERISNNIYINDCYFHKKRRIIKRIFLKAKFFLISLLILPIYCVDKKMYHDVYFKLKIKMIKHRCLSTSSTTYENYYTTIDGQ